MPLQHKIRRSWLLVPASDDIRIASAAAADADVVVLDLAEFVAEQDKPDARESLASSFDAVQAGGAELFVQIDPELMLADLRAAIRPGVDGVIVSRLETPQQIVDAAALIDSLESERGLLPGSVEMVASLETARGNHDGFEIATASDRVSSLTLGRADLVMDLRPEPSGEIHLMEYLMQRLITLAAATGKTPLGAWWRAPDRGLLATSENTLAAAQRGRAIGFKGSLCVLDDQVAPLNQGFTPTSAEVGAASAMQVESDPADRPFSRNVAGQYTQVLDLAAACDTRERFKAAAVAGTPIPLP
jgi:citrate lyase subunit beta/citryl-CoA lyase